MVKARHPQVAQDMMTGFRSQRSGCLSSVTGAVNRLLEVGVHVPEWQEIADATVVTTLHGDGTHRRKADVEDGVALKEARRSKEATYPELCRGDGRARLVAIAGEVGGRWSQETKDFLWCLACEKSKSSPRLLQGSARVGWYRTWCCLLACSTAKAVACSLVGHRGSPGSGDQVPSAHEVLTEARYLV